MPTGTAKTFTTSKNHTRALKKTEKLSGNIRKINREITGKKFHARNIFPQLVVFKVAQNTVA
jgi:hypothetical protein